MDFKAFALANARREFDPDWRGMTDEEYRAIRQHNQRIYDRYQQRLREERLAEQERQRNVLDLWGVK